MLSEGKMCSRTEYLMFFYQCLVQCRKDVCKRLGLSVEDVELSMHGNVE